MGIETYQFGNIPRGEITAPRVTIHVKAVSPQTYWRKGFAEVNVSVPDIEDRADLIALQGFEKQCYDILEYVEEFDDNVVRFSISSTEVLEDVQFKCHFVNARVQYEILNV